ncbi:MULTISPECIES: TIGR03086 family metal-binding protein [Streptomyces]|uniref:TIGR03086 family metal-binding protein n=1 Tax=Streptomyces sudanensis TaxID=436397 RepID=A0ABY4TLE0_9ACTN|nr:MULTISPECIES: TIGR03086 family metal-binding protein [Streptomyces]URN17597.1 TIGR03086 family metal-binding protein [Streptomyces sudanensis]
MSGSPLLARHAEALALVSSRVHAIGTDRWDAPTPCAEWSVRDLVGHLTAEQAWVPALVREGRTIAEVGGRYDGDVLGDDPVAAWDRAAAEARAAFGEECALDRTVHLSYGDTRAHAYCSQMTADAVVHAWDLSRAIGADERLPPALVDFALGEVAPYAGSLPATGLFAEPVPAAPGADAQTRLLNMLGRRP